jgi:hypothetical protein
MRSLKDKLGTVKVTEEKKVRGKEVKKVEKKK